MNFIHGFKDGFKGFMENIWGIMNFLLLSVVYFIGVGISRVVAGKKSFFGKKPEKVDTYWTRLDLKKEPMERYYRQF